MKATIKLYKNDGNKEQGFPIKLILSHTFSKGKTKTRRKTISFAKEIHWDEKNSFPRSKHPEYENLYLEISGIKEKAITRQFRSLDDFDEAFNFLMEQENKKPLDFYEFAQTRIDYMNSTERYGNARAYETAINELKKFKPTLTFKEITTPFLYAFLQHKKIEGLKNTSIKNYLVEARAIYNSAVKQNKTEDTKPFRGIFDEIRVKTRRVRNRFLVKEQIEFMEGLDLEKSYQRAIDLSLLQFYLGGADLIDIYYLKWKDIQNDRVTLIRRKLGDKAYEFDVLLPEKAKPIINKYAEGIDYIFPWRKSHEGYITFRNNHNRNLKILQKRLDIVLHPNNDNLTTKVMRHTFATLGKFHHIHEDILREIMGHERNDIDNAYKAKFEQEERDKAQLKIIY